jgi:DNA-binding XRE family transcriptional regulator
MYLDDAMGNLGEAFDYAVDGLGLDADEFMRLFVASRIAEAFAAGSPKYIAGMSGVELVWEVMRKSGFGIWIGELEPMAGEPGIAYWCGWILAYYQWSCACSFKELHRKLSMVELGRMYAPLHEAGEERAAAAIESRLRGMPRRSALQEARRNRGLSQSGLAERSGVSLRAIQQYEQGAKDIRHAQASRVLALAQVVGCSAQTLLAV